MARVKRTIYAPYELPQAQRLFVDDFAPVLLRLGGFVRTQERPGYVALSDGIRDPADFASGGGDYVLLRRLTAHRLKVSFIADGSGTRITISGGASRDVRQAIDRLGDQLRRKAAVDE